MKTWDAKLVRKKADLFYFILFLISKRVQGTAMNRQKENRKKQDYTQNHTISQSKPMPLLLKWKTSSKADTNTHQPEENSADLR